MVIPHFLGWESYSVKLCRNRCLMIYQAIQLRKWFQGENGWFLFAHLNLRKKNCATWTYNFFNAETMSAVVALRRESPIINFALKFQRAIAFLLELNSKPAKQIIQEIWGGCRWGTCLEAVPQLRMSLHGTAPPMTDGCNHRTQEKTWRKQ